MDIPLTNPFCKSKFIKLVAGLGYNFIILSEVSVTGVALTDWPCDWMAINRIKDNMDRIRLNETNLLLLFEK